MENNKHTSGKWEFDTHTFMNNKGTLKVKGSRTNVIANVQFHQVDNANKKLNDEQILANAKLIATAPELLEALVELKKSMDETIKWQNGGLKHLSQAEQDRYKIICKCIKNVSE